MVTKFGGKKKKRSANSSFHKFKRDMVYKNSDQEYGFVEKLLGDMRCNVVLSDKSVKICRICGSFKRRVWINVGDIVLISIRTFEDKGDIIYKYNADEVEHLKAIGEWMVEDDVNENLSMGELNNQTEILDGEEEDVDLNDL